MYLAIADAALISVAEHVVGWQEVASELLAIFDNKFRMISDVISAQKPDVVCLQEVDMQSFVSMPEYNLYTPSESSGKQDSVILLRKDLFTDATPLSLEASIVGPGDLTLLKASVRKSGERLMIASYHGDANGISTIPFLEALHSFKTKYFPDCALIIGSDTNAHFSVENGSNKLSFSKLKEFTDDHQWLLANSHPHVTTRSCRTFFQAQAHKGHHEQDIMYASDPKDNIIIDDFTIKSSGIFFGSSINQPIPSEELPSDHALVWAEIEILKHRSEL